MWLRKDVATQTTEKKRLGVSCERLSSATTSQHEQQQGCNRQSLRTQRACEEVHVEWHSTEPQTENNDKSIGALGSNTVPT